jgi:hypothetical protein
MSDEPIDFRAAKSRLARAQGAREREVGTVWSECIRSEELVHGSGRSMVVLDNSQYDGFAMTADGAEELAALLVEEARKLRLGVP